MGTPRKPRALCRCGCGREVFRPGYKFYSNQCQKDYEYRGYIQEWKIGLETGSIGKIAQISHHLKRYLREKYGDRCSDCGWGERHPLTGKVPLEVDHITGNASDNNEDNLRLLCPNCHSLTENFRSLNKGRGRANR